MHIKDTFPWKSDDERPVKICIYLAGILDGSADPKGLAGGEGRGVPSPPPIKEFIFRLKWRVLVNSERIFVRAFASHCDTHFNRELQTQVSTSLRPHHYDLSSTNIITL